jgi:glycine cleavage system regulatory protein
MIGSIFRRWVVSGENILSSRLFVIEARISQTMRIRRNPRSMKNVVVSVPV